MLSRRVRRSLDLALAYLFLGLPVPVPAFLGGEEGTFDPCDPGETACVAKDDDGDLSIICVPFALDGCLPEGSSSTPIVIRDLSSKALKAVLVPDPEDADPKDTIVTGVPGESPNPGDYSRRLVLRAKEDGAAAALLYKRRMAGYFDVSLNVAFEDLEGLVDGASTAFFELREVGQAEQGRVYRLDAVWNEAASGFTVSGSNQDGSLGEAGVVSYPGLLLSFALTPDVVNLDAFPTFGEGGGYYSSEDVSPVPLTFWVAVFGVEGLDAQGSFFFDDLKLEPTLAGSGNEAEAGVKATKALQQIENALTQAQGLFGEPGNPGAAASSLSQGLLLLDESEALLAAEKEAGRLDPTTQIKLAERSLKKAEKISRGAEKLGTKLAAKGSTNTHALANKCNRARWAATLLNAQMFGYKSKNIGKLYAEITLPTFQN